MSPHPLGCLCPSCTSAREQRWTFVAREWADVADPVLLAGHRKQRMAVAAGRARSVLVNRYRDEFEALKADFLAEQDGQLRATLERRRANKSAGERGVHANSMH